MKLLRGQRVPVRASRAAKEQETHDSRDEIQVRNLCHLDGISDGSHARQPCSATSPVQLSTPPPLTASSHTTSQSGRPARATHRTG